MSAAKDKEENLELMNNIRFVPMGMGSRDNIFLQERDRRAEAARLEQLVADKIAEAQRKKKPGCPRGRRAPVMDIRRWAAERVMEEREKIKARRNLKGLPKGELSKLITKWVAAAKLEFPEHARKVDDYAVDYLVKHPQRLER